MKQYCIIAYADNERGLKQQELTIMAENDDVAYTIAWRKFGEYKEIGVYRNE